MRKLMGIATAIGAMLATSAPAEAQFFLRSHDMAGTPVHGDEPDLGLQMPGATPVELRAGLIWTLRAALNVAALQCQFEPTLLTVPNYNAMIKDHKDEIQKAFDTVGKYHARIQKSAAAGQAAFDQSNTKIYSAFATVAAQFNFCQTANSIGREAIFTPRGHLGDLAEERMRELRNSLTPYGEQRFAHYVGRDVVAIPRLDKICWSKKGEWVAKKCGAQNWPPAGIGIAAR